MRTKIVLKNSMIIMPDIPECAWQLSKRQFDNLLEIVHVKERVVSPFSPLIIHERKVQL